MVEEFSSRRYKTVSASLEAEEKIQNLLNCRSRKSLMADISLERLQNRLKSLLGYYKGNTVDQNTDKIIVYCIGHRYADDEYRNNNLLLVVQWLIGLSLKNLVILVIEQDKEQKVDKLLEPYGDKIKYLFAYNSGFYNRGWVFNIAFREFNNADYFFFADNDIILPNKDILHVFETCFDYEAVNPYKAVYDTKQDIHNDKQCIEDFCTKKITIETFDKSVLDKQREYTCFSGGICGLSKDAMKLVSGWDERFRGRGWEDYAFTCKLKLFLENLRVYEYDAIHLYHAWETNTTRDVNRQLNEEYENYLPDNYASQILSTSEFFGNIDKYKCGDALQKPCSLSEIDVKVFSKRLQHAKRLYTEICLLINRAFPTADNKNPYIYCALCDYTDSYKTENSGDYKSPKRETP